MNSRCGFFATIGIAVLSGCGGAVDPNNLTGQAECPAGFVLVESGTCRNAVGCTPEMPFARDDGFCYAERQPSPPPDCYTDRDCDDGVFCNGEEWCLDGTCIVGNPTRSPLSLCDEEEGCREPDCRADWDCDDGLCCNGEERCESGECVSGPQPCPVSEWTIGALCNEAYQECNFVGECFWDPDCDDGVFCNGEEQCGWDEWLGSVCVPGVPPCAEGETCYESSRECSSVDLNALLHLMLLVIQQQQNQPNDIHIDLSHVSLWTNDGSTFLGYIDTSLSNDSLSSRIGPYGSVTSMNSIWNSIGPYGSSTSMLSPWSTITTTPPIIIVDGNFAGYLTVGFMEPSFHPNDLAEALGRFDAVR